jgi:hypothetical protein
MRLYRPLELKFDLLLVVSELMLDRELSALGDADPYAGDLDPE